MSKTVIYAGVIVLLAAVGFGLFALTAHDGTGGENAAIDTTNETVVTASASKAVEDGQWELSGPGPVWKLHTADDGTLYSFQGPYGNTIKAIDSDGNVKWTYQVPGEWRVSNIISRLGGILPGYPNVIGPVYSVDNGVLYLYVRENKTTDFNHYYFEEYAGGGSPGYMLKERLLAISGGNLLWDVPLSDEHHFFEDSSVRAQNGRVYVFDEYGISVFDAGGSGLFRIDNASGPAAIDESGNIYIVPAVPSVNPLHSKMKRLYDDQSGDIYKEPGTIVQAYSPDGTLIWQTDIGARMTAISIPLASSEDTIPLYRDGTLYVESGSIVTALGTNGSIMWTGNINDLLPRGIITPENLTYYYTQETKGCPDLAWTGTGMDNSSLTLRIPSSMTVTASHPYTGVELWCVDIPLNGSVVTMDVGHAEKLSSMRTIPTYAPPPGADMSSPAFTSISPEMEYGSRSWGDTVYTYASFIDYERPVVLNQSRCYYASIICAFDKSSGTLLWCKPQDAIVTSTAMAGDVFCYGTRDGRIIGGITRDRPAPASMVTGDDLGKVAGTVAGGAAMAAAAVLFIKLFALGGFTRARGQLDKNDNRNRTLDYIACHPGSTQHEIAHGLGMNVGTIRYHLFILSLNHRITSIKSDGKFVRYFTNGGSYTKDEQFIMSLVRRDPVRRILNLLLEKVEASNLELAEELDMHDSASSRYLKELAAKGLVARRSLAGGRSAYSIRHEYRDQIAKALERVGND